jgi:hypothetical protein
MPTITASKCAKPKGEYCRLHNPAPKNQTFNNIDDVFSRVEKEASENRTAFHQPQPAMSVFQGLDEQRTYDDSCPSDLDEHIQQSKEHIAHLDQQSRKAIHGYTVNLAYLCNKSILGKALAYVPDAQDWFTYKAPENFKDRENFVHYIETLDTVLETRHEQSQVLYRGMPIYSSLHDEIGDSVGLKLEFDDTEGLVKGLKEFYKPGKVIDFPIYLSTSKSADYAAKTSNDTRSTKEPYGKRAVRGIVFELKTNAGLDVTGISEFPFERETVLPRDTHFKVTAVHTQPASYSVTHWDVPDQAARRTGLAAVVQMVEVDENGDEILHTRPHKPSTSVDSLVAK